MSVNKAAAAGRTATDSATATIAGMSTGRTARFIPCPPPLTGSAPRPLEDRPGGQGPSGCAGAHITPRQTHSGGLGLALGASVASSAPSTAVGGTGGSLDHAECGATFQPCARYSPRPDRLLPPPVTYCTPGEALPARGDLPTSAPPPAPRRG